MTVRKKRTKGPKPSGKGRVRPFDVPDIGAGTAKKDDAKRKTAKTKTAAAKRPRDRELVKPYKHKETRKNLPTDQTASTMSDEDARPVPYRPASGNPGIPSLSWDREEPTDTPAGPLYIHEKLHPSAFVDTLRKDTMDRMDSFFGDKYDELPKGAEFEWYQHRGNWQNRIIRGESRHVMASLLAKENMAGKVQMIFFDPPFGINFRNILQANVDKNKDSGELPNDPMAIQTFRDSYKNGIHSYLDNIYRIASHARELLSNSGSFFLQIGSTNANIIGVLLDEVFGAENRVTMISVAKTSNSSSKTLSDITDYLLWYAKDKGGIKYHQLYEGLPERKDVLDLIGSFAMVELDDKSSRKLLREELDDLDKLPPNSRLFKQVSLFSQGHSKTRTFDYEWNGKIWKCPYHNQWSVSKDGLDRLAETYRLDGRGNTLHYKKYEGEIPGKSRNNIWAKQEYASDKHYVVETAESTIEKCMLMTTDPGDLVYDPTCGSGTTAFVAEKWGRRYITSDASLVAINLARQRIMMGVFDWYTLIDSDHGHKRENELRRQTHREPLPPKSQFNGDPMEGFVYKRMPHISAKFLAYPDEIPPIDYIVDQPEKDRARKRVSSPFTIESQSPYRFINPKQTEAHPSSTRQNIVDALGSAGIQVNGKNVRVENINEYAGKLITHTGTFGGAEACILVANDDCTVSAKMIDYAVEEAARMPSVKAVVIVAFAYEPSVINEKRGRLDIYKTMANRDLQLGNLKDDKGDHAFIHVGEPDIRTEINGDKMTVEVIGYDTYNPASGNIKPGSGDDVYCWMIDTNYNGLSFFARRIHFPGSEKDNQIKRFHRSLERHIDPDLWDCTMSLKSAPFGVPESGRIAVKIITQTHSEMVAIVDVPKDGDSS